MRPDELARTLADARTLPTGEALVVIRLQGAIDFEQRRHLLAMIQELLGPNRTVPVLILGSDANVDALAIDGNLFALRVDDVVSDQQRAAIRHQWEASFAGRPVPPVIVLDRTVSVDPMAAASIDAVTVALLDARRRTSVQDQAAALSERFWIVPKPTS